MSDSKSLSSTPRSPTTNRKENGVKKYSQVYYADSDSESKSTLKPHEKKLLFVSHKKKKPKKKRRNYVR